MSIDKSMYALIDNNIVQTICDLSVTGIPDFGTWINIANSTIQTSNTSGFGPGWIYNSANTTFTPPPEPEPTFIISKVAFLNRFEQSELVQTQLAAIVNPTSNTAQQIQSAQISVFLQYLNSASQIDLKLPQTQNAITLLTNSGILTQNRANTILQTPAAPNELPEKII